MFYNAAELRTANADIPWGVYFLWFEDLLIEIFDTTAASANSVKQFGKSQQALLFWNRSLVFVEHSGFELLLGVYSDTHLRHIRILIRILGLW